MTVTNKLTVLVIVAVLACSACSKETEKPKKSAEDKLVDRVIKSIKEYPDNWHFAKDQNATSDTRNSYLYYKKSRLILVVKSTFDGDDKIELAHPIRMSLSAKNQKRLRDIVFELLGKKVFDEKNKAGP